MRCLIAQINTGGSLSPCLGLASYSLLLRSVPIKWNTMLQIKYKNMLVLCTESNAMLGGLTGATLAVCASRSTPCTSTVRLCRMLPLAAPLRLDIPALPQAGCRCLTLDRLHYPSKSTAPDEYHAKRIRPKRPGTQARDALNTNTLSCGNLLRRSGNLDSS